MFSWRSATEALMPNIPEEAAAPRLRHGNRNPQNIYLVNEDGSETFVAVAMTPEYADMIVQRFNAATVTEADIRADERRETAERITAYEDLLGSIWLYIGWRYVTKQLTTAEKEMFADAVEASSRRLHDDIGEPTGVDRWWRDDAPIRRTGGARG
jgi:hypothetical protein